VIDLGDTVAVDAAHVALLEIGDGLQIDSHMAQGLPEEVERESSMTTFTHIRRWVTDGLSNSGSPVVTGS
jgi:hypothetical protein